MMERATPGRETSGELCLDLGWCILRPLSDEAQTRVRQMPRLRKPDGYLAAYAGISVWQIRRLPLDRLEELRLGVLWMGRQFEPPLIGRVVAG